jgi:FkbM family methyltransferase
MEGCGLKHFRDNTWDRGIFEAVTHNEYGVDDFCSFDVVIDIGCHIGSFCWLAATGGAKKVIGFEPSPENCDLARRNLASLPNTEVRNLAVWRSDQPGKRLYFSLDRRNPVNTGAGTVFNEDGVEVDSVSLNDIIAEVGEIDLLKLDCEGSEYPILMTCTNLHKVKQIVGEYHEFRNGIPVGFEIHGIAFFTMPTLARFLETAGFMVSSRHTLKCRLSTHFENIGKFRATS